MITVREQNKTQTFAREELNRIPLITPDGVTNRWKGVQHGELVSSIVENVEGKGLTIVNENWFVSRKNQSMLNGTMNLEIPQLAAPEGMTFALGVIHSNNCDKALKFVVGAQVFICTNGIVVGDFLVSRKHTTNLSLGEVIDKGVDRYLEQVKTVDDTVKEMQEISIGRVAGDRMLMQAGRERLMPWSRIGMVDAEFTNPRFSEFKEKNAWSLYNAFTFVSQKSRPENQLPAFKRFKDIVLN